MKIKQVMIKKIISLIVIVIMLSSFILAGVGIKWGQESALINEREKTCLTYNVYNPWPKDTYVTIELSEELEQILIMQEAETKLIPKNTASSEAIPVEFCFKTPTVYERDCLLADSFICKQECNEEQKVYSGEVVVKSVASEIEGGSATTMAVSAPLNIRVKCNPHSRNFTLIYVIVMIVSLAVIGMILQKKYRKPKIQRDREKLKKLKIKITKESKGKK